MTENRRNQAREVGLSARSGSSFEGVIKLEKISKTYGIGKAPVRALEETALRIDAGDFVSIIGPSGCGKTTLLKICGDILSPTSGRATINEQPASLMRRSRRIGYVFQNPVLLPWRTVRQNVSLPFEIARRGSRFRGLPEELEARIDELLERVGLAEFADRLPRELSGGMQSRVSLARALVHEPSVLLMDEPFAALDELTRTEMALHLLSVWERIRTTVVFITHHIEEAVLLSNQVIVMSSRPGAIRRCLKVDLPRPRSIETRRMPAFRNIVEDLVADFHARRPREQENSKFDSGIEAHR
jgi:NitT/TauT family transport system ATP-binding protein